MSQPTEMENALRRFSRLIENLARITGADPRTIVKHFSVGPARGVVGHRIARALSAAELVSDSVDELEHRRSGGPLDTGTLRRLAADAEVDPRTIVKVLRNEPVRGAAAQRALAALVQAGLVADTSFQPMGRGAKLP